MSKNKHATPEEILTAAGGEFVPGQGFRFTDSPEPFDVTLRVQLVGIESGYNQEPTFQLVAADWTTVELRADQIRLPKKSKKKDGAA